MNRPYCLLLGAGASVPAGIPAMAKMGEDFAAKFDRPQADPNLARTLHSLPRNKTTAGWHRRTNIESLLAQLYTDANLEGSGERSSAFLRKGSLLHPSSATFKRQLLARHSAILALQAQSFVLGQTAKHTRDLSYLDGLADLPFGDAGPLDVFSLNYDTVVEDFCRKRRIGIIDGFDRQGNWDPSLFLAASGRRGGDVRLWKLHGSVTLTGPTFSSHSES